jgi:hypothetical protein
MKEHLARFVKPEGVVFIGKALFGRWCRRSSFVDASTFRSRAFVDGLNHEYYAP